MNGKYLYEVYGDMVDFKNFQGNPMPEYEDLPDAIKEAWEAVASNSYSIELTERERQQIDHAVNYATFYESAGVPGSSQFLLIAKLAKALRID